MSQEKTGAVKFSEHEVLHELKHYLPAQAPLKDFVHHNTLHSFQDRKFEQALLEAFEIFGFKGNLTLREYRDLFKSGKIDVRILKEKIVSNFPDQKIEQVLDKMLNGKYPKSNSPRIGKLRSNWKRTFKIDLDSLVHPTLFRILSAYLDQGISIWNFPIIAGGFMASMREFEKNAYGSLFKSERVRALLLNEKTSLTEVLNILVGDEKWFEQYIFDQQFAHPGWSGIVSAIEDAPYSLLDERKVSLHDLVLFESLMEIDHLDQNFGQVWSPIAFKISEQPVHLFDPVHFKEISVILYTFHQAFEESYYQQVLTGLLETRKFSHESTKVPSFQALFCIDDRECSFRRYIEQLDPQCSTFGTPGFFGVEFYYKPANEKFYTKLCPAPVFPKYLIKEEGTSEYRKSEIHYQPASFGLVRGALLSMTYGFIAPFKLIKNLLSPEVSSATSLSFNHMDKGAKLTIECKNGEHENDLQIGFTVEEMAIRVENVLRSIGLVKDFAPLVYVVGHGASSTNNPHYAAYDCGACSGRAGSVNGRVLSFMANHIEVRKILATKGIHIPDETQFVGALHDTTRDEIDFYADYLNPKNIQLHATNMDVFNRALDFNSLERSRRFESVTDKSSAKHVHQQIRNRSVSLFEPRPELNHATNALCIVGRRGLTSQVFLDRRSFLNSYDYQIDPEGNYLFGILRAAAPVCGGINLEYYFSRVDNQKLGAGSKLPHNVMGLIGVANGTDGDLRPGLPSQMIEVHDPIRLLIIVEHYPEVVLKTIQRDESTYEWFKNEWVHLVAVHPEKNELYRFKDGQMHPMTLQEFEIMNDQHLSELLKTEMDNLPVIKLSTNGK
jgi:uncharacterized protein YbcC (UPF0753/DUF2309 family)